MRRGVVRFARRAGDVSDDTQLAIAVARSLHVDGRYDHRRFVEQLAQWSYYRIGAGRATARAAVAARGVEREPAVGPSEGNGAAIRVAPIAIAAAATGDDFDAAVRQNARSTHDSDAAASSALFVAHLLREALLAEIGIYADRGARMRALVAAAKASSFAPVGEALERFGHRPVDDALAACGTSGHVSQCIPAAALVLLDAGLDFRRAMETTFRAGGDTDSIGSIVGSVIGAQLGEAGLPGTWVEAVEHRDYLRWLADRLAGPVARAKGKIDVEPVEGDIAASRADVVVNAWNRNVFPTWLLVPQGVSRALRRGGGAAALRAMSRRAPLPLGAASLTRGGDLPCDWVVHVAGINLAWYATETSVRLAVRNALSEAEWLGAGTVAMPLVGCGTGGLHPQQFRDIAVQEALETSEGVGVLTLVEFVERRGELDS